MENLVNPPSTPDAGPRWATSHADYGRLYSRPGATIPSNVTTAVARGDLVPSVTTVLDCANKPFLTPWAARMAVDAIQEAHDRWPEQSAANPTGAKDWAVASSQRYTQLRAAVGTAVHQQVEALITGASAPVIDDALAPEVTARVRGFEKFAADVSPEFLAVESSLYGQTSDGLGFAGTADFVATIAGRCIIGDWKTSKRVSTDHTTQVETLANTLEYADGDTLRPIPWQPHTGLVVSLKPNTYELVPVTFTGNGWRGFEGLRRVWQWLRVDNPAVSLRPVPVDALFNDATIPSSGTSSDVPAIPPPF